VTARRVATGSAGSAGRPVRFTFDGRACDGIDGEPLAVALLAVDRVVLSRSFRFHRPRGLMCSTGQCGWCECEVDGVPSVRTCRVPVRDGLVVRGEHAWPSVERDLLSFVGLFSRWIPPTFYHHRFLRPRRLRKRYLDVLRWFGGRGRLSLDGRRPPPAPRPARRLEADVLVVGAAPSGIAAATAAARSGSTVILLDADGTATHAEAAGVQILAGVAAIGWYEGMVTALGDDAAYEITARSVVAATGSYDRVPLVPGADRPGVMGARLVVDLIDRHGILPGRNVLLVGDGEVLAPAAERLRQAGATIHGPIPTAELVAVRGRRRVSGADVLVAGRRERLSLDLVVFGDRSPNLDLVLAAGAAVERRGDTLVPDLDGEGRTTVPSLSVVGSAAGRSGPTTLPSASNRAHDDAMVCFCEDVRVHEVRAELAAGYRDPELVKRRTGTLTGPCQGKSCLQAFACLTGSDAVPTARPPLRPVRLGDLVPPP
jgi:sarcosine oxidase subunit alpha